MQPFDQEFAQLSPKDTWLLEKIEGYLQLGMTGKCQQLLGDCSPALRKLGIYKALEAELASREERWSDTATISQQLVEAYPDQLGFRIQWAYATRRCEGIEAAEKILTDALDQFSDEAILHYNLGCYACMQDQLELAKKLLTEAFKLDAHYLELALEDEDLEQLRDFVEAAQKE